MKLSTYSTNRRLSVVLCAVLVAGCAPMRPAGSTSSAASPMETASGPSDGPVVRSPAPSSRAAIAQARTDSIRRPYSADDIDFMSGMIAHHSQAVKMASWAPTHGASNGLQIFAGRISMAQKAEIGLMQTWLGDRNQTVPPADPNGMKMMMGGSEMNMLMPGMLTVEQMVQLDHARGKEFDRLFLTYMIQHHNGAISMVNKLFASNNAGNDEIVFKFANDVQADQETEINRMQEMLTALAGGK